MANSTNGGGTQVLDLIGAAQQAEVRVNDLLMEYDVPGAEPWHLRFTNEGGPQ